MHERNFDNGLPECTRALIPLNFRLTRQREEPISKQAQNLLKKAHGATHGVHVDLEVLEPGLDVPLLEEAGEVDAAQGQDVRRVHQREVRPVQVIHQGPATRTKYVTHTTRAPLMLHSITMVCQQRDHVERNSGSCG